MGRWENYSGSTVSVPVVNRDVDTDDVVEVPDDVVLPANYFRLVDEVSLATPVVPDVDVAVEPEQVEGQE